MAAWRVTFHVAPLPRCLFPSAARVFLCARPRRASCVKGDAGAGWTSPFIGRSKSLRPAYGPIRKQLHCFRVNVSFRRFTDSIFGQGRSIIGTPGGFEYRRRFYLPGHDRRWGWQNHSCGLSFFWRRASVPRLLLRNGEWTGINRRCRGAA
jgi:hypothetical protein